jgi:hypothetical protein
MRRWRTGWYENELDGRGNEAVPTLEFLRPCACSGPEHILYGPMSVRGGSRSTRRYLHIFAYVLSPSVREDSNEQECSGGN